MNAITEYFLAKRRAMEAQAKALEAGLNIKPKYDYDSDEDVDGGTWEHKKRDLEMTATRGTLNTMGLDVVRGDTRMNEKQTRDNGVL